MGQPDFERRPFGTVKAPGLGQSAVGQPARRPDSLDSGQTGYTLVKGRDCLTAAQCRKRLLGAQSHLLYVMNQLSCVRCKNWRHLQCLQTLVVLAGGAGFYSDHRRRSPQGLKTAVSDQGLATTGIVETLTASCLTAKGSRLYVVKIKSTRFNLRQTIILQQKLPT